MIGALVGETLALAAVVTAGLRAGVLRDGDTLALTSPPSPGALVVVAHDGVRPLPRWAHAGTIAALAGRDAGRILSLRRVLAALDSKTSQTANHGTQEAQL